MYEPDELSTDDADNSRIIAQAVASIQIHKIRVPLCGFLVQLTSTDCINVMKYELDNWSIKNPTSTDRLLIHYFITDYICCGLSSPSYYSEFQRTLQSDKSKIRLLKDLLKVWDYLFKHYSINCTNFDFVKKIVDSLERLFVTISNLIPDNNNKLQYNNILDKIKHSIKLYEHYSSGTHTPHTSSKNIGIENKVPKKKNELEGHLSQQSLGQSMKTLTNQKIQNLENKKHLTLINEKDRNLNHKNSESIDQHLSIKPKPISNDVQNVLNGNTKSDSETKVLPLQPKLNAFQVLMLNAQKFKKKVK